MKFCSLESIDNEEELAMAHVDSVAHSGSGTHRADP